MINEYQAKRFCSEPIENIENYENAIADTTQTWLYGVYSTGNFYNIGTATYTTGSPSGIPTGWTEHTSL